MQTNSETEWRPLTVWKLLKHYQPFREAFKPCPLLREAISGPRPWRVFPAGALLCVAELVDCLPTWGLAGLPLSNFRPSVFRRYPKRDTPRERAFGNYEPYRYAWVLDNIQAMPTAIPYSGHQGLHDLDPAFEKRVLAARKGTK